MSRFLVFVVWDWKLLELAEEPFVCDSSTNSNTNTNKEVENSEEKKAQNENLR